MQICSNAPARSCSENSRFLSNSDAPDFATAEKIFALAKKYNTPFFSSSALRYADELKGVSAQSVMTTGGGRSLEEYIIHQTEMVVKLLGTGAKRAQVDVGAEKICRVEYGDGRSAVMIYDEGLPFNVYVKKENGETAFLPIVSQYFKNLLSDILHFYETGEKSFCGGETLEVMKVREAVIKGEKNPGVWVEIR